jgi:hypothetical protein
MLKDVKLAKRNRSYPWADERLPVDVDRNFEKTCVLDLMIQHDFMKTIDVFVDRQPNDVSEIERITIDPNLFPRSKVSHPRLILTPLFDKAYRSRVFSH